MLRRFVGGNWKCNNTLQQTKEVLKTLEGWAGSPKVEVSVAPVALHLPLAMQLKPKAVEIAAQNCSPGGFGAFTGELSPLHLKDFGVKQVILGHSERRTLYGQSDEVVAKKVAEALKHELTVIACFGETLQERESNSTFKVLEKQLAALSPAIGEKWGSVVLAYEPVWAIGTGKTASSTQVQEVHKWIREFLAKTHAQAKLSRVIYGGSVTEKNAAELIAVPHVDGFLVGGASLKPAFLDIIKACC